MIDGWQVLLEVGNGELAIATGWSAVFLFYHVAKVGSQRRVWSWRGWRRLPQAMQLAVSFLSVALATFTISAVIWFGGDNPALVSVARLLSVIGFLCVLRVITRPMRWQWPWVGAMCTGAVYLVWCLMRLA